MISHVPRHRELGRAAKMLRKVRWLRVTHPRPATMVPFDLDVACRASTPTTG